MFSASEEAFKYLGGGSAKGPSWPLPLLGAIGSSKENYFFSTLNSENASRRTRMCRLRPLKRKKTAIKEDLTLIHAAGFCANCDARGTGTLVVLAAEEPCWSWSQSEPSEVKQTRSSAAADEMISQSNNLQAGFGVFAVVGLLQREWNSRVYCLSEDSSDFKCFSASSSQE